ncbi:MAG: cyclic nucleotide-binding domain-containing protein [Mariprofundaceae bacterium]
MSIDIDWLEKNVVKRALSSDERAALACVKVTTFTTGQAIITQGQPGGTLYLLRSGKASVEDNQNGNRMRLADVAEGDCFGALTFLNGEPTTAEVLAHQDCEVYSLDHDDFSTLMRDQQTMAYEIFTHILEHQTQVISNMRAELLPVLRKLKQKADSLPLFIKLLPVLFIITYVLAFFYISWKDFSY